MKVFSESFNRLSRITLGLVLGTQAVIAQVETEPALDYYQIEVIVFRQAGTDDPAYRWPGQPDTRAANDLFPTNTEKDSLQDLLHSDEPHQAVYGDAAANLDVLQDPTTPGPALLEVSPIQPLDAEELALADAWRRLDRNRGYQPLVHLGWRQQASPFSEAQPVRIHGGTMIVEVLADSPLLPFSFDSNAGSANQTVEELDGSISFERSRFLHLHVDLALHIPLTQLQGRSQAATPLLDPSNAPDIDEPYRTYRLVERRQIKTGSINYFDHRRFGVIALVDKWEPPVDESTDSEFLPEEPPATETRSPIPEHR